MELPRKQAETVRKTLERWRAEGLLDEATGKRLLDDLVPMSFDWRRLGRYARRDDGMLRGYGLVFLFLNLYTAFSSSSGAASTRGFSSSFSA